MNAAFLRKGEALLSLFKSHPKAPFLLKSGRKPFIFKGLEEDERRKKINRMTETEGR